MKSEAAHAAQKQCLPGKAPVRLLPARFKCFMLAGSSVNGAAMLPLNRLSYSNISCKTQSSGGTHPHNYLNDYMKAHLLTRQGCQLA